MRTVSQATIEQAIDRARVRVVAAAILHDRDRTKTSRLRLWREHRILRDLQQSLHAPHRTLQ